MGVSVCVAYKTNKKGNKKKIKLGAKEEAIEHVWPKSRKETEGEATDKGGRGRWWTHK